MLIALDNVLTIEELDRIRSLLREVEWGSGLATAGTLAATVKNNQQVPESAPQLAELRQIAVAALQRNPVFHSAVLPLKVLPPFFNRHADSTNAYGLHIDNAMRPMPDGGLARSDISCTLFLSDPQSYEGGELVIEETLGRRSVKLSAGSLVLYPSTYLHEVAPVVAGERLACFTFIQSMIRDPEQRRLLFDMDMAMSELKQTLGATPQIMRLSATYHNLLRRWADS